MLINRGIINLEKYLITELILLLLYNKAVLSRKINIE